MGRRREKVILRIATSGAASWDVPYSGDGTPAWVYADGARSVIDSGETIPVYWDQAYLTDYQAFVQAFGAEFNGNSSIAFIESGIGMGGRRFPRPMPRRPASPHGSPMAIPIRSG